MSLVEGEGVNEVRRIIERTFRARSFFFLSFFVVLFSVQNLLLENLPDVNQY